MAPISSITSSPYDQAPSSGNRISSTAAQSSSGSSAPPTKDPADPLANKTTFLKLLVSQLKNQNPMNPMDGTTFVTQLAQFSNLEQSLAMRQDLDLLATKYGSQSGQSETTPTAADNGVAHTTTSAGTRKA